MGKGATTDRISRQRDGSSRVTSFTYSMRLPRNDATRATRLHVHRDRDAVAAYMTDPRSDPNWIGACARRGDLCADIEEQLRLRFRGKPVGIARVLKDVAFSRETLEGLWLETFTEAHVLRLPDAGHYLQEDAHEQIVPALIEHLGR